MGYLPGFSDRKKGVRAPMGNKWVRDGSITPKSERGSISAARQASILGYLDSRTVRTGGAGRRANVVSFVAANAPA